MKTKHILDFHSEYLISLHSAFIVDLDLLDFGTVQRDTDICQVLAVTSLW